MPRSVTIVISFLGLIAGAYLILHRAETVAGLDIDTGLDSPLFGLAILVVSVLLLATGIRGPDRDPSASDSMSKA
jgi:hypothetical protein